MENIEEEDSLESIQTFLKTFRPRFGDENDIQIARLSTDIKKNKSLLISYIKNYKSHE